MGTKLAIGIDLGSDTVKIAYALDSDGEVFYGKFAGGNAIVQIAIPAIAYYSEEDKEWLYGTDVERSANQNFITVVKIKSLLSLLSSNKDESVCESNEKYYRLQHSFPKFYFPIRKKMLENFAEMVEKQMAFIAPDYTPQMVCESFFKYLGDIIDEKTKKLQTIMGEAFSEVEISLVYPSHVGDKFAIELERLARKVFGNKIKKTLSSTKALAYYAKHRNLVGDNDDVLVFEMGEEYLSVVKACHIDGNLVTEGVEGHNLPLEIGGVNVDESINDFLEKGICSREIIGTGSFNGQRQIDEHSTYAKQYLLMKDIKKAKIILSRPLRENSIFNNGVPVSISRDLILQRKITRENLLDCVGVSNGTGVAKAVFDYIESELLRPGNSDVKKIIISGGLSETYGLTDFIKNKLKEKFAFVNVYTFDDNCEEGDEFSILSYEDNIYSQAVGSAIVALKNIEVKTVISLSYATWSYRGEQQKTLDIFVNRGQPIDDGREFFTDLSLGKDGVTGEEIFSTIITESDIKERKYAGELGYSVNGKLLIGDDDSAYRRATIQKVDLKIVAGGPRSKIYFRYDGEPITILNDDVLEFIEGIRVDKHGKATPFIRNCSPKKRVEILWKDRHIFADARDIEIVFDNVSSFSVSKG